MKRSHRIVSSVVLCAVCVLTASAQAERTAAVAPTGTVTADVNPNEDDVSVESRALRVLRGIPDLRNPGVVLRDDVLMLSGTVPDERVAEQAAAEVAAATGMDVSRSELRMLEDVGDRLESAAERVDSRVERLLSYLPLIPFAALSLAAGIVTAWLLTAWRWPYRRATRNPFLRDILRKLVQTSVVLTAVLIALEILDATALVGGVLGAAGVAGIAIGFAFRDLIENYIASILLSLRQPFKVRDHVIIDNHEGLITTMNSRTTVLTTFDGNVVRIPNAMVFKTTLVNYTSDPRRRFVFEIGVGYDVDLPSAIEIGVRVLKETEGVMPDPGPFALITKLGESSITIKLFGWVDQGEHDFGKVRSAALQRVKTEYDRFDIDMPEPIYKIKMDTQGGQIIEQTNGDRERAKTAHASVAVHDVRRDDTAEELAEDARRQDSGDLLSEDAVME